MRQALLLVLLPLLIAATYTDTLTADFSLGNTTQTNATGDAVYLNNATLSAYNTSGTYTSRVFDLGSNPSATINWGFSTPTGTSLLVSTRSGNSSTDFSSWSSWSSDYSTSTGSTVTSPVRRYYQYRAQLATTNTSNTPVLNDVSLVYTEGGTSILAASSYNTDLMSNSTGNYAFYINVSDTFSVLSVSARYRFNSGTWSNSTSLTQFATDIYNITVPQPSGGWSMYANGTLNVEVTAIANNGSANTTQVTTVQEAIQFINTPPTIDPFLNKTQAQGDTMNMTVTGTDPDVLTPVITYTTNRSDITVTSLTNTSARLTWAIGPEDIGYHIVNITANDTVNVSSRLLGVNVTDINDAPTLSSVAAITGYHGVKQLLVLTAVDLDSGANITFSMSPAFFPIVTSTTYNNATANNTYYGIANFTPADPEHGVTNVTFFASDGTTTVNTSTTMTIDYCGDLVCQATHETASTCPVDCAAARLDSIAFVLPEKNCVNQSMRIQTFNASDRFHCYYQGLVDGSVALCEPLEGVSITVYERNSSLLVSKATLTSDANGTASFTPAAEGEYKISAKKEEFANSTALVYVRECTEDIVIKTQNITVEQAPLPPLQERPKGEIPLEEEPGLTREEAGLLQIVLFYFVVPLLLAMLLYAGIVFYDVNKDTLPWLLEARIVVYEQRMKYKPQLDALEAKTAPFVAPVVKSLTQLYVASLKPVVDKLKNLRKKP